jgi:nucleotide-binding universal stress UspA family protein
MTSSVIVVGVDGSPASRTALRWALEEAAHSGAKVEATMAWHHEPAFVPASSLGVHPYAEIPEQQRRHPARELHDLVEEVRAELPGAPEVTEVTIVGDATTALVDASRQADLLVVGAHGHGPLAEVFLGSVAADCVRHSACPVVLIPRGATS